MGYLESIGKGFRLVNENWQLVLIHAVMFLINVAGFLVFIGVPLVAGIVALGLDVASLGELESFLSNIENPLDFISQYVGLLFVILLGVFAYVIFVLLVWIYVIGGSAGVLGQAIKDPSSRFSLKTFFSEGRRLFFTLLSYIIILAFMIIGVLTMLGLLGFIFVLLSGAIGQSDTFFGFFFKVLFSLGFILLALIVLFLLLGLGAAGFVFLVLENRGPVASLDRGLIFLKKHPGCLWLLALLILGYGGIQLVIGIIGYGLQLTDVTLLSLPYQIIANVFQGYLSLVVLGTILTHVYLTTSDDSSQLSDISRSGAFRSNLPPEGSNHHL